MDVIVHPMTDEEPPKNNAIGKTIQKNPANAQY